MADFNFHYFKQTVIEINGGSITVRQQGIINLLNCDGLNCHIENNDTDRGVYSVSNTFEYPHELATATKLTAENYDVVFMPAGFFGRNEKKYDVLLCRDHLAFQADLKSITSTNPDTIGKRIKEGSHQAPRLVLDINSGIPRKDLIQGLKIGCERNDLLKEIMLFYNHRFYRLFISQILSNRIYDIIK